MPDFLDHAVREARKAKTSTPPESDLARRQSAEKIWGYVASELNRAFRSAGYGVEGGPHAHADRRKWLREIDRALGKNLAVRHEEYAELHGDCFYESKCPVPDVLEQTAREAKVYVEDVRKALTEVKRRGVAG